MLSFRIVVNGVPYLIEVEDLTQAPLTVYVNGEPFSVEIEGLRAALQGLGLTAPSPVSPSPPPTERPAERRAPPPTSGRPSPPPIAPARPAPRPAAHGNAITAPMPGVILELKVGAGDEVSFGMEVCTLSAMKMEQSIKATVAGRVTAVRVEVGQNVAHGDVLFELE